MSAISNGNLSGLGGFGAGPLATAARIVKFLIVGAPLTLVGGWAIADRASGSTGLAGLARRV